GHRVLIAIQVGNRFTAALGGVGEEPIGAGAAGHHVGIRVFKDGSVGELVGAVKSTGQCSLQVLHAVGEGCILPSPLGLDRGQHVEGFGPGGGAAHEDVVSVPADQSVGADAADEDVAPAIAEQRVISAT